MTTLVTRVRRRARVALGQYLEFQSVRKHKSRLPSRQAGLYADYLSLCRRAYRGTRPALGELSDAVASFHAKGFASFWSRESAEVAGSVLRELQAEERAGRDIWDSDSRYRDEMYLRFPQIEQLFRGPLGSFLEAVYGAYFKVYYGVLYKSERVTQEPTGSQLWHYDGGPGTCINVMVYLKDVAREDGAMECLPWDDAVEIYKKEMRDVDAWRESRRAIADPSRAETRAFKTAYLAQAIAESYADRVEQPVGAAGLVVAFRNNSLHRGGFPEPGRSRYACVFHCYPSDRPTPFDRYRRTGIPKRASYPADPAEEF